jgi:hypothetical protein
MARTDKELRRGEFCQHCGGTLEIYQVRLTRGLAKTLIKMRRLEVELGRPELRIHVDDLNTEHELTFSERGNLSRLRFLGLARYTESHSDVWFITSRGYAFLRGEEVPVAQYIYQNKIVDRLREDHITTNLTQVFKKTDVPYFEQIDDIRTTPATKEDLKKAVERREARQAQLLDVPVKPQQRSWA